MTNKERLATLEAVVRDQEQVVEEIEKELQGMESHLSKLTLKLELLTSKGRGRPGIDSEVRSLEGEVALFEMNARETGRRLEVQAEILHLLRATLVEWQ